jgi:hypothetical protein
VEAWRPWAAVPATVTNKKRKEKNAVDTIDSHRQLCWHVLRFAEKHGKKIELITTDSSSRLEQKTTQTEHTRC